jgi:hypothetical protein
MMGEPGVVMTSFVPTSHAEQRAIEERLAMDSVLAALERPYRVIRSRNRRDACQYLIDVDGVHVRAIVADDGGVLTVMRHRRRSRQRREGYDVERALRAMRRSRRSRGPKRKK